MTPDQLAGRVETIVSNVLKKFDKQIDLTQNELFNQLQAKLSRLDINPDGTIKQSQANRKILADLNAVFKKTFKGTEYYDSLNDIAKEVGNITNVNIAYFNFMKEAVTVDAQYLKSLQKQVISQLESLLANEGLTVAIKQPIMAIMNQNINTSAAYSDLLKQTREFILGSPELKPKLQSYAGQITTDTLFNYSRSIQEAVSGPAGLQFVVYSGGLVKDSREFCVERAGNYYHKREVEEWASLDWQGKRPDTTESTIFIYAGGYRCLHQIIYVSEFVVPDDVIQRAKDLGFYEE